MQRDDLYDLMTFLSVARERSFTRAAAQLGMSQSTLSHAFVAWRNGSRYGCSCAPRAAFRPPRLASGCW
jgi:hypothetical protein